MATGTEIAGIRVVTLHYEYPPGEGFVCAEGITGSRVSSIVEITLGNGVRGIGSAYSHPDLVRLIIEHHLAPFLVGEDARQIEMLWKRMYGLTGWYGRKGVAVSALGAVDVALWDIRGKLEDKPVYALLGGTSPNVEAYASALLWADDPAELGVEVARHLADGFRSMKMRLGRSAAYDRQAVSAVCAALGPKGRIAVDGSHRYTLGTAERLSSFLAEKNVLWFEEPFPPADIDAYAALRRSKGVAVAAGENEFGVHGFRELFRHGCVDVAQPDVSRTGGLSEGLRIAQEAEQAGVRIATHTWSDAVALAANAHLVAATPSGWMVEVDRTGNPFLTDLVDWPLRFEAGRLTLPDRPGLGIELDSDEVARFALDAGQLVPDGNYGDLIFGREYQAPLLRYDADTGDDDQHRREREP